MHRARHLALGADMPDDDLAAALESAAGEARDRGLPIAAADLAEHAVRLTPSAAADDRHRRAMAAARMHEAAGEGSRARAIAAALEAGATAGRQRAESLVLRAELERPALGLPMLEQALSESTGVPELQSAVHCALAEAGFFSSLRGFAWSERHARAALRLSERLDDDGLRAGALGILAVLRFTGCDPLALPLAEQAYRLATEVGDPRNAVRAIWPLALVLTWQGRTEPARDWLERRLEEWRDRDDGLRAELDWYLAIVEVMAGRWDVASGYVDDVEKIGIEYEAGAPYDRFPAAFLALHRGEIEIARERSRSALGLGLGAQLEFFYETLAMCDAWSGSPMAALENFTLAERAADAIGEDEPSMRFWRADHVEVLLQVGRIEEATLLLAEWEAKAALVGRERVIAEAMRCRGLIAMARGDLSGGAETIEAAIDMHGAAGDPFGRARTLLALGMARRRLRQKRTARQAMEAALAEFVALGALGWAATARVELARIGGRQRLEGLSPSELGVATLAAEGRTNREIAAALFLGERTVAGHLTHIYSKLGIRSRTELAGTRRRARRRPRLRVLPIPSFDPLGPPFFLATGVKPGQFQVRRTQPCGASLHTIGPGRRCWPRARSRPARVPVRARRRIRRTTQAASSPSPSRTPARGLRSRAQTGRPCTSVRRTGMAAAAAPPGHALERGRRSWATPQGCRLRPESRARSGSRSGLTERSRSPTTGSRSTTTARTTPPETPGARGVAAVRGASPRSPRIQAARARPLLTRCPRLPSSSLHLPSGLRTAQRTTEPTTRETGGPMCTSTVRSGSCATTRPGPPDVPGSGTGVTGRSGATRGIIRVVGSSIVTPTSMREVTDARRPNGAVTSTLGEVSSSQPASTGNRPTSTGV